MKLPIGISNFQELITYRDSNNQPYLFIDKSLLIKELIGNGIKVSVIMRPRRFGKTLNLSMLRYFCAATVNNEKTLGLFNNLKIAQHSNIMVHQGKYPVIFLSLKDIKCSSEQDFYVSMINLIIQLYKDFRYLIGSQEVDQSDQTNLNDILNNKAQKVIYANALQYLIIMLYAYHKVKPIVLIDEYDTPIQAAYLNGYYKQCMDFMSVFLGGLKDNDSLGQSIVTGILRVSKESLFSGWNNTDVYSILDQRYAQYFGFTTQEVDELLQQSKLMLEQTEIKSWYNGYHVGTEVIYNPWSIISCLSKNGILAPYWINTSGNALIKQLLIDSEPEVKAEFQQLLNNTTSEQIIDEHIVFDDLKNNNTTAIWSLMLLSGYLTALSHEIVMDGNMNGNKCVLKIPNKEILYYYKVTFTAWLSGNYGAKWYSEFMKDLTIGAIESFASKLKTLILETLSYHDVSQKTQEQFYHAFLLGLTIGLRDHYEIYSNRESGLGRFDIALIPKDSDKLSIIMELKASKGSLEATAKAALAQIKTLEYTILLKQKHIANILLLGIAFSGKDLVVVQG